MTRLKLRVKALGACTLVFSLMAVWAGAAQAESTGGSWTYINAQGQLKTFEGELANPEIGGEIDTIFILHSEVFDGTTRVLYECKKFEVSAGSKLKANGVLLGKLVFRECVTLLNGVASAPCTPVGGMITTNLIKAQMLLHKLEDGVKDKILIAEGETAAGGAANLATIESTATCALGIKVPLGGKLALELTNPTTHEVKHLFKEFTPLMHLWILSDTLEHKASLLGSGWLFLAGIHAGLKWAGLWN